MSAALELAKKALHDGDASALRHLLESHADLREAINQPLFSFNSPALVAVSRHGSVDLVDVLLEFGADPNVRSSWWGGGFHALHGATPAVAERLLAAGAIPDACAAAHLDQAELLKRMLAEDPARVHERGGDGQMPLHFARSRRVVDLLLDAGADIDARDVDHRSTAAEWMIGEDGSPEASRAEIARYLVERGASADIFLAAALGLTDRAVALLEKDPSLLALRTGQGEYGEKKPSSFHIYFWTIGPNLTPLQTAAKFKQRATLAAMSAHASPVQRLLIACHQARRDAATAIVKEHPGIVQGLTDADRRVLTDEARAANAPAVELMLELGFDPAAESASGPTGGTALHCAAWEGSVACTTALLRHPSGRALVAAPDSTYGGTPLHWCCHGSVHGGNPRADHVEVARLLLAAGAGPDSITNGSDAVAAVIQQWRAAHPG
jgi:ankyrin repeat protein